MQALALNVCIIYNINLIICQDNYSYLLLTWLLFTDVLDRLSWPLDPKLTDPILAKLLFPDAKASASTSKRMPDYAHIRKELLHHGVNKKLLWTEYLEECRLAGDEPLMYSQFCYYIQQDEQRLYRNGDIHYDGNMARVLFR